MRDLKVYIAGKITGFEGYREKFRAAADRLESRGHTVMNPAVLPDGFEVHEYMRICYAMIDTCEAVYFLDNWQDSAGANREFDYALLNGKEVMYEEPSYYYFTFGSDGQLFKRGYVKIKADSLAEAHTRFVNHYGDKAWKSKDERILSYAFPYDQEQFETLDQFKRGDWSICHEVIE